MDLRVTLAMSNVALTIQLDDVEGEVSVTFDGKPLIRHRTPINHIVPGALTLGTLSTTSSAAGASSSVMTIEVTGRQWFWDVDYPEQHVRTANDIHIPVGETVTIVALSGDVIHSFWVPELAGKQ